MGRYEIILDLYKLSDAPDYCQKVDGLHGDFEHLSDEAFRQKVNEILMLAPPCIPSDSGVTIMDLKESNKQSRIQRVERDFTYHAPKGDQTQRYEQIREKAKEFALLILDLTPVSLEQDQALMLLNLTSMSANAAIARNE